MSCLSWKIRRIRAMSLSEILFRIGRLIQGKVENCRLHYGWQPQSRQPVVGRGGLFQGNPKIIRAKWSKYFGADIENYKSLLAGNVVLFDQLSVNMLKGCNWHEDPESHIVAPLIYGKGIDYRDNCLVGNCKTLWELSRHDHLVPLAVAYSLTGDKQYADMVVAQIESWIEQNPFGMGVHWCSALEVALRLISWSFIESFFSLRHSRGLFDCMSNPSLFGQSIYQHAYFIRTYLSRHSSANNHLIGELTGLWVSCNVFELGNKGEAWAAQAKQELEKEAQKQVFGDGVNKEQATYYHLWVMEYLYLAWLVAERYEDAFSEAFRCRVEAMERFINILRPVDGTVPQIGDSDDGFVVRFGATSPVDVYGDVCSAIQVGFGGGCSIKHFGQKAFWYNLIINQDVKFLNFSHKEKETTGTQFYEGGYTIIKSREAHLVFDAGNLGYSSIAAHGHADTLSFILALKGIWWLVDPGTYCYHTEKKWRDYFRGTAAHNTVEINGLNQSLIGGPFLWIKHATPKMGKLKQESHGLWVVDGCVRSYANSGILHKRKLFFKEKQQQLCIHDEITGGGSARIRIFFHFHPKINLRAGDLPGQFVAELDGSDECMIVTIDRALEWTIHRGEKRAPLGWYSEQLGRKESLSVLVGKSKLLSGTTVETNLSW